MRFKHLILLLFFCLTLSMTSWAAEKSLSTQDLLGYSLDALRAKMDAAVNENQKLSIKNSSIRNRILSLKKQMRELDDAMMKHKENVADIKRVIKLDAKDLKVDEKRMNNMLERKRQLEFERDTLKNKIDTSVAERQTTKESIKEAEFDVKELQGDLAAPTSSNLLDYYEGQKLKLSNMVRDYRKRIEEKRNKLDYHDVKMADKLRDKEVALRKQDTLERTVSDWEMKLKEEDASESLLKNSAKHLENVLKNKRQTFESQYEKKRKYIKELTNTINDLKASQQTIEQQFDYDSKEMKRMAALLGQQNDWLFRYSKALETESSLTQKKQTQEHTAMLLEEQKEEVEQHAESLKKEKENLQDSIVKQHKINQSLERDQERLQKTLEDLTTRVDKVKNSVAVARKDAFGKQKEEVRKALKEQEVRVASLKEKLQATQKNFSDNGKKVKDLKAQQNSLQQELQRQQGLLAQEESSSQDLARLNKEFSRLADKQVRAFQLKIQDALMKKQALQASVDVIHKKYSAGEDEAGRFESEQAELNRYLKVLKQENLSLQHKLEELKG